LAEENLIVKIFQDENFKEKIKCQEIFLSFNCFFKNFPSKMLKKEIKSDKN
jgi:hypothetical protein